MAKAHEKPGWKEVRPLQPIFQVFSHFSILPPNLFVNNYLFFSFPIFSVRSDKLAVQSNRFGNKLMCMALRYALERLKFIPDSESSK